VTRLPPEPAAVAGVDAAYAFACEAYGNRLRRSGRSLAHPMAVAALLADDRQPTSVVISGLLHDVLEDTQVEAVELEERFGVEIARIVSALTQDEHLDRYRDRKAALRQATLEAGPAAAAIALGDKAAKLHDADRRPRKRKLRHYRATLDEVEARYGPSRLAAQLRAELQRWR
jgi:(p)ppGpp synthase/HD superfamily hydrolase